MPFQIIRNDITKVKADAIVNTANPEPIYAAGTDSAIYHAAGEKLLLDARKKIGAIEPGNVAVTPAFCLKAKHIIHTVGPAWIDGNHGEFDILRSCYEKSLTKAAELGCKSIAFPLIATGVYGFPKAEALTIATNEIRSFLMREDTDMTVKLVIFDDSAFILSRNIFSEVESFIDDEQIKEAHRKEYKSEGYSRYSREDELYGRSRYRIQEMELQHITRNIGKENKERRNEKEGKQSPGTSAFRAEDYKKDASEDLSFQTHLIKLLNEKAIDNVTAYKRSNISKGAFSKILCGDTKKPLKKTVLQLCIGLHLDLHEAQELLASADFGFNQYSKRDKLVIKFILEENYNIDKINDILFICDQPLLM
ncbi:MAG: macro domain-containing protein [Clostridiales bacterium]|nr:macro domain-containing protein [Clostridiales bacterium]